MRLRWIILPVITVVIAQSIGAKSTKATTANDNAAISNAAIMAKLEAEDEKIDKLAELVKSKIKKDESIEKEELSIADQVKAMKKEIINHMVEQGAKVSPPVKLISIFLANQGPRLQPT